MDILALQFKWPNDIYLDSKKCGGIITQKLYLESPVSSECIVFGLGLNTYTSDESSQDEKGELVNNITNLSKYGINNDSFTDNFIHNIVQEIDGFNVDHFLTKLNKKMCYVNEEVDIFNKYSGVYEYTGVFRGVNIRGNIQIETNERDSDSGDKIIKEEV